MQDDAAIAGRLPALRAAVSTTLPADDPRRDAYLLRIDAALAAIETERLTALQAANVRPQERPLDADGR